MFESPGLNALMEAELASGNRVVEDGPGWGGMHRPVLLAGPFRTPRQAVGSGLEFREINDRHDWLAEVEEAITCEVLACRH